MKVGILGAGGIAVKMAETISYLKDVENYAIASRSLEKAKQFAASNHIAKAYGYYEELVEDEKVDLVYIALPHSHHYENMLACIEHKKHVLCEKAFTANAGQAADHVRYLYVVILP